MGSFDRDWKDYHDYLRSAAEHAYRVDGLDIAKAVAQATKDTLEVFSGAASPAPARLCFHWSKDRDDDTGNTIWRLMRTVTCASTGKRYDMQITRVQAVVENDALVWKSDHGDRAKTAEECKVIMESEAKKWHT